MEPAPPVVAHGSNTLCTGKITRHTLMFKGISAACPARSWLGRGPFRRPHRQRHRSQCSMNLSTRKLVSSSKSSVCSPAVPTWLKVTALPCRLQLHPHPPPRGPMRTIIASGEMLSTDTISNQILAMAILSLSLNRGREHFAVEPTRTWCPATNLSLSTDQLRWGLMSIGMTHRRGHTSWE